MASRQQIVERAEAYIRGRRDSVVRISTLCLITGLSERGLRNAFYEIRGMSPTRYIRAERLAGVRQALCQPDTPAATVTRIATAYGFTELGRFAATYKQAFGETPSETLRHRTG